MKTKMKKAAVMLMSLIMVMCYMPMMAFAEDGDAITTADALKTAINSASGDVTVTLGDNISLAEPLNVPVGANITLNLNGKTISNGEIKKGGQVMFIVEGALKVTGNGTMESTAVWEQGVIDFNDNTITSANDYYVGIFKVNANGTLVVENGSYESATYQTITNLGTVIIEDGTFTGTATDSGKLDGRVVVAVNGNSSLEMKKGTITTSESTTPDCGMYGIYCNTGGRVILGQQGSTEGPSINTYMAALGANHTKATADFTIYGGNYSSAFTNETPSHQKWQTPLYLACDGKANIYGGTFNGKYAVSVPYKDTKIDCNIYGGTFASTVSDGFYIGTANGGKGTGNGSDNKISVTGGTFTAANQKDDVSAYFPNSYYTQDDTGKVTYNPPYIPTPTPTPSDNVTNNTGDKTTTADVNTTTTTDGKAEATVDKTTADKIVDKAVENKSEEIVIDASTTKGDGKSAEVKLPAETIKDIVEKTDADVVIKTDAAEVALDQKAAEAVAEKAATGTVSIVVEKVKEDDTQVQVELKVVTENGNVTDFKGGNAKVTVALPEALKDKEVVCVYIDEDGNYVKMEGKKNADGTYTFTTGHFSTYAVMTEEEADKVIAEQEKAKNDRLKAGVKATTIKASSSAKKGSITIKWKKSNGFKVDYFQVFRSTKKNGGYGTKAFYTTKSGTQKSYKNTKALKKGTRYYYKVRGVRTIDGVKVYTKWSTKAIRTAK